MPRPGGHLIIADKVAAVLNNPAYIAQNSTAYHLGAVGPDMPFFRFDPIGEQASVRLGWALDGARVEVGSRPRSTATAIAYRPDHPWRRIRPGTKLHAMLTTEKDGVTVSLSSQLTRSLSCDNRRGGDDRTGVQLARPGQLCRTTDTITTS